VGRGCGDPELPRRHGHDQLHGHGDRGLTARSTPPRSIARAAESSRRLHDLAAGRSAHFAPRPRPIRATTEWRISEGDNSPPTEDAPRTASNSHEAGSIRRRFRIPGGNFESQRTGGHRSRTVESFTALRGSRRARAEPSGDPSSSRETTRLDVDRCTPPGTTTRRPSIRPR
jgi:hypothetical protein